MKRNCKGVGILTAGGDCPGINAVIRSVAKKLMLQRGLEIIGIEDGYEGLVTNHYRRLEYSDLSGILTLGGTILGTSKKSSPYKYAVDEGGRLIFRDMSRKAIENFKMLNLSCLVCIGGDGTMGVASRLHKDGIPVVGVPKTIDNDIVGTDLTFGFETAVSIATEGIDRIHTTAQSHHRVMIVEVMGHNAGWLALFSGIAGGGDIILIPEIPYDIKVIADKVKERHGRGKRFSIIVAAEGARPKGGTVVVQRMIKDSPDPVRLGGVGFVLGAQIEKATGIETRTVVMGHLQRGGSPTALDRILATRLGSAAADLVISGKFGYMVGINKAAVINVLLSKVAKGCRTVPLNHPMIKTARDIDTSFGDK